VRIPLVDLILKLRQRRVREGFSPKGTDLGMRLFGAATASPALFSAGERLARLFWPLVRKAGGEKVAGRLPKPAATPFHRRIK
jgi:L-lactate dehydrogenase complex protein LldF